MNKFYSMKFSHRFLIKEILNTKNPNTIHPPILTPHILPSTTKPPPPPIISFGTPPNTPPPPPSIASNDSTSLAFFVLIGWLLAAFRASSLQKFTSFSAKTWLSHTQIESGFTSNTILLILMCLLHLLFFIHVLFCLVSFTAIGNLFHYCLYFVCLI